MQFLNFIRKNFIDDLSHTHTLFCVKYSLEMSCKKMFLYKVQNLFLPLLNIKSPLDKNRIFKNHSLMHLL